MVSEPSRGSQVTHDTFWFTYNGRTYNGTYVAKGKSGRKFELFFDEQDLSVLLAVLGGRASQMAGEDIEFCSIKPPKVFAKTNKKGVAKITTKFTLDATAGDVETKGKYVLKKVIGEVFEGEVVPR